ncbi:hypothetical protein YASMINEVIRUS_947 [Yasminevirus sp. GU-2018]|uniref:Uncharacterized protein n=1 Tax=Yasminevirus sp. GU-2018 TaxID=2420051 RepID=A0A5K0UAI9_9VIRU|nr:hypothetical protein YASMINEVIRUS_947 [Yasminevirus sp. GU-2018]
MIRVFGGSDMSRPKHTPPKNSTELKQKTEEMSQNVQTAENFAQSAQTEVFPFDSNNIGLVVTDGDNDGTACAAIVLAVYADRKLQAPGVHAFNRNDRNPQVLLDKLASAGASGKSVLVTDTAPDAKTFVSWIALTKGRIQVCDHHISTANDFAGIPDANKHFVQNTKCSAQLVCELFFPDGKVPANISTVVDLVNIHDLFLYDVMEAEARAMDPGSPTIANVMARCERARQFFKYMMIKKSVDEMVKCFNPAHFENALVVGAQVGTHYNAILANQLGSQTLTTVKITSAEGTQVVNVLNIVTSDIDLILPNGYVIKGSATPVVVAEKAIGSLNSFAFISDLGNLGLKALPVADVTARNTKYGATATVSAIFNIKADGTGTGVSFRALAGGGDCGKVAKAFGGGGNALTAGGVNFPGAVFDLHRENVCEILG